MQRPSESSSFPKKYKWSQTITAQRKTRAKSISQHDLLDQNTETKNTSGSAMAEGPRDALVEILQLQNIPFEN